MSSWDPRWPAGRDCRPELVVMTLEPNQRVIGGDFKEERRQLPGVGVKVGVRGPLLWFILPVGRTG